MSEEEAEAAATPAGSSVLKDLVLVLVVICILICFLMFAHNWFRRTFREKQDIGSLLGLCLAQICNEEDRNPFAIIKHGVGTNPANINQWVEDIWETYDYNDDGSIDKRELKKFIDQTFEKVGIQNFNYTEFDLDDFFN